MGLPTGTECLSYIDCKLFSSLISQFRYTSSTQIKGTYLIRSSLYHMLNRNSTITRTSIVNHVYDHVPKQCKCNSLGRNQNNSTNGAQNHSYYTYIDTLHHPLKSPKQEKKHMAFHSPSLGKGLPTTMPITCR